MTTPAWAWGPFSKIDDANPCLGPQTASVFACPIRGPVAWEEKDVFNPAAVVKDGQVYLLYRAEDKVGRFAGTSRIGLASSADGLHFSKLPVPVLYPGHDSFESLEWEGGCEDPRIVQDEAGVYYLTYTAFDGVTARLCVATSTNLIHWQKHGLAFGKAGGGKYRDLWCKSGSIVCRPEGERMVAARIDGLYWMYWGESNIYAATSENLIDWTPVERVNEGTRRLDFDGATWTVTETPGEVYLLPVLQTRRHRFDSALVEPGPPAVITDQGILLLYNGKNHAAHGDPTLPNGAYCAGQVLLDPHDPTSVIGRTTAPFLVPDRPYEVSGQVATVCFIEGLVRFEGRWLLYYGTADSKIAVAQA